MTAQNTNKNSKSEKQNIRFEHELKADIDDERGLIPFAAWVKQACREKLERDRSGRTCTPKTAPKSGRPDTPKDKPDQSANAARAEAVRSAIFDPIESMGPETKAGILGSRYPKKAFRDAIGEAASRDSIAKYWTEIEEALKP